MSTINPSTASEEDCVDDFNLKENELNTRIRQLLAQKVVETFGKEDKRAEVEVNETTSDSD